jgi:hypothetical protein
VATVQSVILKLYQAVDPYTKAGAEITLATVGTVDSDKTTKQRMLDILNDAHIALFQAMRSTFDPERLTKELSLAIVSANVTTDSSAMITLPSGYFRFISLVGRYYDTATTAVSTKYLPIILIDPSMFELVMGGVNPYYTQSDTNRFVIERGAYLVHHMPSAGISFITNVVGTGTVTINGTTAVTGSGTSFTTQLSVGASITVGAETKIVSAIASATALTVSVAFTGSSSGTAFSVSDYKLTYFGLPTYALSDITGGSTTEAINVDYHPILIQLGVAIANGQGNQEVNSLAKQLLTLKG